MPSVGMFSCFYVRNLPGSPWDDSSVGALSLFSAPVDRWGGDGELLTHGAKEKTINPFTTGTPLFSQITGS